MEVGRAVFKGGPHLSWLYDTCWYVISAHTFLLRDPGLRAETCTTALSLMLSAPAVWPLGQTHF